MPLRLNPSSIAGELQEEHSLTDPRIVSARENTRVARTWETPSHCLQNVLFYMVHKSTDVVISSIERSGK
jgi:hypothetical protein